ncbi:hypothetical protein ACJA88_009348 [Fusarium oxysporum]
MKVAKIGGARLFELEEVIGGAFANRVYEDAEPTCFVEASYNISRLPKQFAKRYPLCYRPSITLGAEIRDVNGDGTKGYVVEYTKSGEKLRWECDAVAVCLGLHREPNMPAIIGLENVPHVMHSSDHSS